MELTLRKHIGEYHEMADNSGLNIYNLHLSCNPRFMLWQLVIYHKCGYSHKLVSDSHCGLTSLFKRYLNPN